MAKNNEVETTETVETAEATEAATTEEATEKSKKNTKKDSKAHLKELVPVKLYKDAKNKGDVLVTVNGQKFQIQRGKEVMVPQFVKEVLDNQEKMKNLAVERMEQLQANYAEKEKAFS
ncbi:hypothetical protein [Pseudobutyrivibrio sp.]